MSRACRAMKNICRQSEDALDALDTRRGPHARQLACGTPMWEETESRSAVARRSLHRMVFKVYERQGSEHGRREERQQEGKRLSPALLGLLGINFLGGREERGEKDLIERLEQLFKEGKHQEIKELIEVSELFKKGNVELSWRLARAYYNLSEEEKDKDAKRSSVDTAMAIIEKALNSDQENFAVLKWYGIILNRLSEFQGTAATIENSYKIKDMWERAAALNPKDATTRYLIGEWSFSVADITFVNRQIASALFATPPTSSFDEALRHFMHAEKLSPGFWSKNELMIAKCYVKLEKMEEAKLWLARAEPFSEPSPTKRIENAKRTPGSS